MKEYPEERWSNKDIARLVFYTFLAVFFLCGGAIFVAGDFPILGAILLFLGTWHVLENIAVGIIAVNKLKDMQHTDTNRT